MHSRSFSHHVADGIPRSIIFTLLTGTAVLAVPPRFTVRLTDAPPPRTSTFPSSMNDAGAIAGYAADEQFSSPSVPILVYGDGEVVPLGTLADSYNFAMGVSDYHYIVGVSGFQPMLWIGDSGTPLTITPGFGSGSANDINVSARVCGSVGDSDFIGPQHCVWPFSSEPAVILPGLLPNSTSGAAWAVNEQGQIAGVSGGQSGTFYAVRWDRIDATPLQIGPLPGAFNSEGLDLNEHGDVVGRSSYMTGSIEAMLYREASSQLVGLGFLPSGGPYSFARGVNNAQQVVGEANIASESHAFLWQDGVMYDLNGLLASADPRIHHFVSAVDINNPGQIAALAQLGDGSSAIHAIALLTPVVPGDLDGDGDVDINDLTALLSGFGCQSDCAGDLDGDGDTDLSDLTILLSHFGFAG